MANDIDVKVGADTGEAVAGIDKVSSSLKGAEKSSQAFSDALGTMAIASGAAFATLVAGAFKAFDAFADAEKSSKALQLSLQNQGVAGRGLEKTYKDLAKSVSAKTGIDDDAIVAGQAILQNFLGQAEITPELTAALADLSIKTGSVESAADLLGKAVQGNTKGLKQYGIQIDANLSQTERLGAVTAETSRVLGGLAETTASGTGSINKARVAFGNFLENIGERLAPLIISGSEAIANFFNKLNDNKPLLDFIFEIGKIAALVLGTVASLTALGAGFVKVSGAVSTAITAVKAFGIAGRLAVGATGVGLILIVIAEIALNWNKIWPVLTTVFQTFVSNISTLATAAGKILSGVAGLNVGLIKQGVNDVTKVIAEGFDNIAKIKGEAEDPAKEAAQNAQKLALARDNAAKRAAIEQNLVETRKAQQDLDLLNANQASTAAIELKKKELETLKALKEADSAESTAILQEQLAQNRALQDEQFLVDVERRTLLHETLLASNAEFQALSAEQQAAFLDANEQELLNQVQTEKQIRDAAIKDEQKTRQAAYAQSLNDQRQYGTAIAAINEALNSTQTKGAEKTAGELVKLQTSKNATLRAIGKAAAVTQITIDTARSAVSVFQGFTQAIPFPPVSIPLGIAAAGAVVAFGAEQIATVLSAQTGGIVPGANTGGDSIPSILQAGELVVPRQNFSEVVNAVAASRSQDSVQASSGVAAGGAGGGSGVSVELQFSGDNAEKFLTARRVEARSLGTLRESTA